MLNPICELQYAHDRHKDLMLEAEKRALYYEFKSQKAGLLHRLGVKLAGQIDLIRPVQNRIQHEQTLPTMN